MARDGKESKQICYDSTPFQEHFNMKEAKTLKSDRNDSFQDPRPKKTKRVTFRDTNHAVANKAAKESDLQERHLCRGTQPQVIS